MSSVPVIVGSLRQTGNGVGLVKHLLQRCEARDIDAKLASDLMPAERALPIGPVTDPNMPALVTEISDYPDEDVRAWSRLVSESIAVIIITPQYNWSFPGHIKNLLDHLYFEWNGKPILVITYGARGDTKCSEALSNVLEGGLRAQFLAPPVNLTLPSRFIRGADRFDASQIDQQDLLEAYQAELDRALEALKQKLELPASDSRA